MSLLESVCRVSDNLFIWTHYADPDRMESNPNLKNKFGPLQQDSFRGLDYGFFDKLSIWRDGRGILRWYGKDFEMVDQDAIVSALRHFGHQEVAVRS